jgi:purine-binding chemotaxis protein CheW
MIDDAKAFLKDLQTDCLREGEDYLSAMREELIKMKNNPLDCMIAILKILHSIKGNFQAAGFLFFGKYVHELENILDKKHSQIGAAVGNSLHESDILDFEFLISGTILAMDSYIDVLKNLGDDSEEYFEQRSESLNQVGHWNPLILASSNTVKNDVSASLYEDLESEPTESINSNLETAVAEGLMPESSIPEESVSEVEVIHKNLLYLLFQNSQKHFAIEIEYVVEVIKAQTLSVPPFQRKSLVGLLNLRGEVLPIINVPQIEFSEKSKPIYIVVSQFDELRFGFQVEAVHQVISFDTKDFQNVYGLEDKKFQMKTHKFCQYEDKTVAVLSAPDILFQLDILDAA